MGYNLEFYDIEATQKHLSPAHSPCKTLTPSWKYTGEVRSGGGGIGEASLGRALVAGYAL